MTEKECCNHDCRQSRDCPIRAFQQFQREEARAARQAEATALASEADDDSSSLYDSPEKKYIFSSIRLALLVYAVFALVTFVFYRFAPL